MPLPAQARLPERVLWALQQEQRPLGVYQLAHRLTAATGRRHHPNAIYRVLNVLLVQRRVLPVASAKGWVARRVATGGATIAMLCRDCGSISQLSAEMIEAEMAEILARRRFRPRIVHLEVLGRCQACADRSPGS
mgnify:FL=1